MMRYGNAPCAFLREDGTCAFHADEEVREYCVQGPCGAYMELSHGDISPIYYNEESDQWYRDVDGIRLVYEAYETHGSRHCGRLIGWYRPGEKETESPQRIYEREAYAQMLRGMIE